MFRTSDCMKCYDEEGDKINLLHQHKEGKAEYKIPWQTLE